jgi:hypothetical protein
MDDARPAVRFGIVPPRKPSGAIFFTISIG